MAAIELMRELDPDAVSMEIRMPVMDGVAATHKLTRLGARARVPILTTYDRRPLRV
jgi:DNA-binding NarL/FixJ family response regulator